MVKVDEASGIRSKDEEGTAWTRKREKEEMEVPRRAREKVRGHGQLLVFGDAFARLARCSV